MNHLTPDNQIEFTKAAPSQSLDFIIEKEEHFLTLTLNILVLGTSNSVMKNGWTKYLHEYTNLNISNLSLGASCSILGTTRLLMNKNTLPNIDYMFVDFCINDCSFYLGGFLKKNAVKEYVSNIIKIALEYQIKPIFLIFPTSECYTHADVNAQQDIRDIYLEACRQHGVMYIDFTEYTQARFTENGYESVFLDQWHYLPQLSDEFGLRIISVLKHMPHSGTFGLTLKPSPRSAIDSTERLLNAQDYHIENLRESTSGHLDQSNINYYSVSDYLPTSDCFYSISNSIFSGQIYQLKKGDSLILKTKGKAVFHGMFSNFKGGGAIIKVERKGYPAIIKSLYDGFGVQHDSHVFVKHFIQPIEFSSSIKITVVSDDSIANETEKTIHQIEPNGCETIGVIGFVIDGQLESVNDFTKTKPKVAHEEILDKLLDGEVFDELWYLSQYPDVLNAGLDPYWHYVIWGRKEGRRPSDGKQAKTKKIPFDAKWYLKNNASARTSEMSAYEHYMQFAFPKGKRGAPLPFHFEFKRKLRKYVAKLPAIPTIYRAVKGRYLNVKRRVNGWVLSDQNMPALNTLSDERINYCDSILKSNFDFSIQEPQLPLIDISVVLYNNGKWLPSFVSSLLAQSYPLKKINLHFVDNGSTDNTLIFLESKVDEIDNLFNTVILHRSTNNGFGSGHDIVISQSQTEYCLVANIDLQFTSNAIINVVKNALRDTSSEVASWELRQIPYEHPKYYDPVTLGTNWSSHACILIRKSAYDAVGGYEPKIFMYAEDVELSYRFRSQGYKLQYCPSATVHHFTYEEKNQTKPLQYKGSILGNAYVRLRYGNKKDKMSIRFLYSYISNTTEVYSGSHADIKQNKQLIHKHKNYFSNFKIKNPNFHAPFRAFDYELSRAGAFHEIKESLNDNTLVSIIVRTYRGRERLLKECLMSIYNQTYRNFEIIVVEDGGSHQQHIIDTFKNLLGEKLRYFALEKVGRSATGNHGLHVAKGQYCMFLDDDDLVFADHIETLIAPLIEDSALSATYSLAFELGTEFLDDKKNYRETYFETHKLFFQEFNYTALLDHNYFPIQSVLFSRTLFLERGGFNESFEYLEDWNLWLRYAYNRKFKYIEKTTSLYRVPVQQNIKAERHAQLHKAYVDAKQHAVDACKNYY